jgi:tRNA(fMet)-specific endonuclease VapC
MDLIGTKKIKIPSMVAGEFLTGIMKKNNERQISDAKRFLSKFEIVSFDEDSAFSYSKIRSSLENKGNIIGSNDLIIASTVLSRGGTLVTNNTKEFERIEGLCIEDWSV